LHRTAGPFAVGHALVGGSRATRALRISAPASTGRAATTAGRAFLGSVFLSSVIVGSLIVGSMRTASIFAIDDGNLRFVRCALGIGGGRHMMCAGPGQLLIDGVATAAAPTLLGIHAAAAVMLTGEWLVGRFGNDAERRKTDHGRQIT
jgi:hypothetical protein